MKLFTLSCLAFVSAAMALQHPGMVRRQDDTSSASSSDGKHGDCRDTSCPGGTCVSSDASNADAAYICQFPPASPSTSKIIDDCRKPGGACPGGFCVSSNTTDPDAGFYCSFTVTPEQSTQLAQIAASSAASSNGQAPITLSNVVPTTKASSGSAPKTGSSASATDGPNVAAVASISAAVHTGGASKVAAGQGLLWVLLGAIAFV